MKALMDIQARLKAPKSQVNAFGKYKYRSCEDILEAVKPLLGESSISAVLTLSDDLVMIGDRYYVKATATLTDCKGVKAVTTAYAREELDKKGMDAAQITGACSSYARKYALNGLFLIDDTKDQDTVDNTKQEAVSTKMESGKATPQQKIEIRSKMVSAGIQDRDDQMDFYNFVITKDTEEKANRFIDNFDEALKTYRKSKEK